MWVYNLGGNGWEKSVCLSVSSQTVTVAVLQHYFNSRAGGVPALGPACRPHPVTFHFDDNTPPPVRGSGD